MATSMKDLQATIDEQSETIDQVRDLLEDAYQPESSREDLATAIGQALDVLSGEDEDEEEDDDQD
jgi:hypothetical protein